MGPCLRCCHHDTSHCESSPGSSDESDQRLYEYEYRKLNFCTSTSTEYYISAFYTVY